MRKDHTLTLHLKCDFCATESTLVMATVSMPLDQVINCSICGGELGVLSTLIDQQAVAQPPTAPDLRLPTTKQ